MSVQDQLIAALRQCVVYVKLTRDLEGIWEVTDEDDLAMLESAREETTAAINAALLAVHMTRN